MRDAIVMDSLIDLISREWCSVVFLTNPGAPVIFLSEIFCIASIFPQWESDKRARHAGPAYDSIEFM